MARSSTLPAAELGARMRAWGRESGFADVAVSRIELGADAAHLGDWLREGFHGSMAYMARSAGQRASPQQLRPGTVTVISARMDCQPPAADAQAVLDQGDRGYIARYALGRDY
ncbi:MAG: QueG-associated DUF1730 domain-containing protein, partial [Arenimonas sp.]